MIPVLGLRIVYVLILPWHKVATRVVPRMIQDGFHSWDGLAIRGNNSSVAAKGCRRIKIRTQVAALVVLRIQFIHFLPANSSHPIKARKIHPEHLRT